MANEKAEMAMNLLQKLVNRVAEAVEEEGLGDENEAGKGSSVMGKTGKRKITTEEQENGVPNDGGPWLSKAGAGMNKKQLLWMLKEAAGDEGSGEEESDNGKGSWGMGKIRKYTIEETNEMSNGEDPWLSKTSAGVNKKLLWMLCKNKYQLGFDLCTNCNQALYKKKDKVTELQSGSGVLISFGALLAMCWTEYQDFRDRAGREEKEYLIKQSTIRKTIHFPRNHCYLFFWMSINIWSVSFFSTFS